MTHLKYTGLIAAVCLSAGSAQAAQVFATDLIVQGSACIGIDCTTSESFGFDTLRLKENNLRLNFTDTSTSASFPGNDWTITANDSSNGGNNYLRFDDVTNNRQPFTVEANAPNNALFVASEGRIGVKTSDPAVDVHIVEGNSPTLRLDQDGSDGFQAQVWDLAGNESNFFIRDVTNASLLPFRIKPGAPTDSVYIAASGDVGMGTDNPSAPLHIRSDQANGSAHMILQATRTDGRTELWFEDGNTATANDALRLQLNGDTFNVSFDDTSGAELVIEKTGDVTVRRKDLLVPNGSVIVGGSTLTVPDYVFAPEYELMPLEEVGSFISENSHLPHIPSAAEINAGSMDMVQMQLAMLKTIEELTLYTLEQNDINAAQADLIETLQGRLTALETE